MKNFSLKVCPPLLFILLALLLASCGSKDQNTVVSTTVPQFFYSHGVAFRNISSPTTWGYNTFGQLGNGVTTGESQFVPGAVIGDAATSMAGVSAGGTHTLAFKTRGNVFAWGNNGFGQLGDATNNATATPVKVFTDEGRTLLLSEVIAISAGANFSLALDNSFQVWAWGDNTYSQLGDSTLSATSRLFAVPVRFLITVQPEKIAAGSRHALALSSGAVLSWGYNAFGQLGHPSTRSTFGNLSTANIPENVRESDFTTDLSNVTAVAAGGSHSLFLVGDSDVRACGYNLFGQLGDGSTTNATRGVVQVKGLPAGTVIQIAAGLDHSLALINGEVWSWGYNFHGQLGNPLFNGATTFNTTTPVTSPVKVQQIVGNTVSDLTGVEKIVAIGHKSLAKKTDGSLWAWGDNSFGQLGIALNDTTNRRYATRVTNDTNFDLYAP